MYVTSFSSISHYSNVRLISKIEIMSYFSKMISLLNIRMTQPVSFDYKGCIIPYLPKMCVTITLFLLLNIAVKAYIKMENHKG